ncbi:MAG: hypothetical protein WBP12_00880 [Candidatus Saccharimonas sp.]
MDSDKDKSTPPAGDEAPKDTSQQAPADALSRTPDDLDEEAAKNKTAEDATKPEEKKISPIKRFFRKVNIYLLLFILVCVIAGIITWVSYLNATKAPEEPNVESQSLTQEALKQLANSDATVGNTAQTLTIKGNAVIEGQTLARGNLNVAGNLQTGGSIQGPTLTISGQSNLGATQINSLQVATNTAIQGSTTLRDLSVSGTSTFSGAITASQITVTNLVLSGNASLQVPNHIAFTGPTPNRTMNGSVVGSGGTVSISGSDTSGTISINSGNNPTAGCFARIAFAQAFTRPPHVLVSPVGSAAGQTQFYVDRDTTGFSICSVNAAQANQVFAFDYFVTN